MGAGRDAAGHGYSRSQIRRRRERERKSATGDGAVNLDVIDLEDELRYDHE
jgi:hypothetical protein